MKSFMQVVVSLDSNGRWQWQMKGSDGRALANGTQAFATYSLAVQNANEVRRSIPGAPIEMQMPAMQRAMRSTSRINRAFAEFCKVLGEHGIEPALKVLNDHIPHRYSAVYWLPDVERLLAIAAFDKLGQAYPPAFQSVPYNESFCQFAIREGQFRTVNTALDSRLDGHAYQGILNSYHAVPLVSPCGVILGTMSHFDMEAVELDDDDFELLRMVARVVVHHLPRSAPEVAPRAAPVPLTSVRPDNG